MMDLKVKNKPFSKHSYIILFTLFLHNSGDLFFIQSTKQYSVIQLILFKSAHYPFILILFDYVQDMKQDGHLCQGRTLGSN